MNFSLKTDRLLLNVLDSSYAPQTLAFLRENQSIFEPYEALWPHNYLTVSYQRTSMACEYNLAMKLQFIRFWVYRQSNPSEIIGTVSFHDIKRGAFQSCEIGYKFAARHQHQGYAYEALSCCISHVLDDLKLHRIEAHVLPDNSASIALLEKLGFRNEGICYANINIQGDWKDHYRFSLIHKSYTNSPTVQF